MNLMLEAMFVAVVVGMFVKSFGRRELIICAALAAGLTLLYHLRPYYIT
jgi:hypothetical protein